MSKTVLVTGGAGFIGSHLCERLVKNGERVICMDNFFTGYRKNIAHLLKYKNFKLVGHDVEDSYYYGVDEIYNLACPAAPIWYQKDPVKTIQTSVQGAIHALELAKKLDCKVLQASTSEVYGDPEVHPQVESYWGSVNPNGPRSCYDEGKRAAESLFFDYLREHEANVRVVRIFNTYGPRMAKNDGRVVSNFITQALDGDDITIYGDGSQTRSFCYIDDLVEGLIKMMDQEGFNGPCNLGNPHELSILEIAQRILNLISTSSKIVYKPLPVNDPVKRQPDISLAKKELNWEPKISVDEGFARTVMYYMNQNSKGNQKSEIRN